MNPTPTRLALLNNAVGGNLASPPGDPDVFVRVGKTVRINVTTRTHELWRAGWVEPVDVGTEVLWRPTRPLGEDIAYAAKQLTADPCWPPVTEYERSFQVADRKQQCLTSGCTETMLVPSLTAGDEQLRAAGWRVYRGTTQGGADLYDVRCPRCSAPDPKTTQAVRALEAGR